MLTSFVLLELAVALVATFLLIVERRKNRALRELHRQLVEQASEADRLAALPVRVSAYLPKGFAWMHPDTRDGKLEREFKASIIDDYRPNVAGSDGYRTRISEALIRRKEKP